MQLNKSQDNRYSRDKKVLELLKANKALFVTVPRLVEVSDELESVTKEIGVMASRKDTATAGTTEAKSTAEANLINSMMMVGGALRGLSRKKKDPSMKEQASVKRSRLGRMRAQELSIKAESLYEMGLANAEELIPRGTDAARLALLRTRIDAFDKAVGVQGTGLAKQVSATKSLPDLLKEADEILHDEINGLVENLRDDYAIFCAEYDAAMVIKDLGTRHNPPENPPEPPKQ